MKFDMIIGNPPYQNGKNHVYYMHFLKWSMQYLEKGGDLIMITPNRIFIPDSNLNKFLRGQPYKVAQVWLDLNKDGWEKIGTNICAWWLNGQLANDGKAGQMDLNTILITSVEQDFVGQSIVDKYFGYHDWLPMPPSKSNGPGAIFISRQWRRWNSITGRGGHRCFKIDPDEHDGRYYYWDTEEERENFLIFIHSFLFRYVCSCFATAMNITSFLFRMPNIFRDDKLTEERIFDIFGISREEQLQIKELIK